MVGIAVLVAAVLIVFGFATFEWIGSFTALDLQQGDEVVLNLDRVTWDEAGQSWLAANKLSNYSLDAEFKPEGDLLGTARLEIQNTRGKNVLTTLTVEGGSGDVRRVDRLLLLIPIGAVILGLMAVAYTLGWLAPEPALLGLAVLSFVLLVLPFVWEEASTANWHAAVENQSDSTQVNQASVQAVEDFAGQVYATTPHKVFAALAVFMSLSGLIVPSERFQTTFNSLFYNQKPVPAR